MVELAVAANPKPELSVALEVARMLAAARN
jgi:hypothetical protein